jgi:large subunit ribosomal protein L31
VKRALQLFVGCTPSWTSRPISSNRAPQTVLTPQHKGAWLARASAQDITMKSETHPNYDFMTVVMTNGTTYQTRSTIGGDGKSLSLDIDPSVHPAWTGSTNTLLDRGGRVARFKDKFAGFMKK